LGNGNGDGESSNVGGDSHFEGHSNSSSSYVSIVEKVGGSGSENLKGNTGGEIPSGVNSSNVSSGTNIECDSSKIVGNWVGIVGCIGSETKEVISSNGPSESRAILRSSDSAPSEIVVVIGSMISVLSESSAGISRGISISTELAKGSNAADVICPPDIVSIFRRINFDCKAESIGGDHECVLINGNDLPSRSLCGVSNETVGI